MSAVYDFNIDPPFFHHHYEKQSGGSLPVFRGRTRQRGYGLGGVFSKMFAGLLPIVKNVAKAAGKGLIRTGANIARDVIAGESFSNAASSNFSKGGKALLSSLSKGINGGKRGGVKRRTSVKGRGVKSKQRRITKDIFK